MDTFMKADIFFFVTTIAVVTFLLLGSIVAFYVIKILRNVHRASQKLEEKIEAGSEQASALYHKIVESFLFNMLFGKKAKKTK